MIVSGLAAVSTSPCTNGLPPDAADSCSAGKNAMSNAPNMILTPNKHSTRQPVHLTAAFTVALPSTAAAPAPDSVMNSASTSVTARVTCMPARKPPPAAVRSVRKHSGPTASCSSIPKRSPLKINPRFIRG